MSFIDSIKKCLSFQYGFKFDGRASRSEFWWFWLFCILCCVLAGFLDVILIGSGFYTLEVLSTALSIGLFVPELAVAARRLHDLNKSAWWLLLLLIPLIGFVILVIWWCMKGTQGPNRFGLDTLNQQTGVYPQGQQAYASQAVMQQPDQQYAPAAQNFVQLQNVQFAQPQVSPEQPLQTSRDTASVQQPVPSAKQVNPVAPHPPSGEQGNQA